MKRFLNWIIAPVIGLALITAAHAQVFGDSNGQPSGFRGKMQTQGTPPALSSCGTSPALASGSTDLIGEITTGTGSPTGCVLTFAVAFKTAPFCIVSPNTAIAALSWVVSTTALTITQTGTSSQKLEYFCVAKSGG